MTNVIKIYDKFGSCGSEKEKLTCHRAEGGSTIFEAAANKLFNGQRMMSPAGRRGRHAGDVCSEEFPAFVHAYDGERIVFRGQIADVAKAVRREPIIEPLRLLRAVITHKRLPILVCVVL